MPFDACWVDKRCVWYSMFWYWQKYQCKNFTWTLLNVSFYVGKYIIFFLSFFVYKVMESCKQNCLHWRFMFSFSFLLLKYVWIGFDVVVGFANGMSKMKFTQFLSVYRNWLNRNKEFSVNVKVASNAPKIIFSYYLYFFFVLLFEMLAVLEIMPFVVLMLGFKRYYLNALAVRFTKSKMVKYIQNG